MKGALLVSNPLERYLGFYDFGSYTTAPGDANVAVEKIADPGHEEITADLNSDERREFQTKTSRNYKQRGSIETETNPEPGKKAKQRLKRKQQDEEIKTTDKRAKTGDDTKVVHDTTDFLKVLWTDIQASAEKLFIIKRPHETNRSNPASWQIVQVDLEETN